MAYKTVSVIIVNWNGRQWLDSCLKSLEEQTYKDFEIILVDNGSTDGSVEWVGNNYPYVDIVALHYNAGFGEGNNIGIAKAHGEYIALLNNDTQVDSRWLSEIIPVLKNNPSVHFCASKILYIHNKNLIDSAGDELYANGLTFFFRGYLCGHPAVETSRECLSACAAGAVYRKELLLLLGGFDSLFSPAYYEDVDIGLQAAWRGFKGQYIPSAIVYHHGSATAKKNKKLYFYLISRNSSILLLKNLPIRLYVIYFPFRVLHSVANIIRYSCFGCASAFVKGKIDFLLLVPKILKKRSQCMAKKTCPANVYAARLRRGWLREKWLQYMQQKLWR